MPQISVVVPIYKVEKYLPACLDSILAQTFKDFEVILVDDGSPDNCGAIADDYATRDERIRVIHKQNAAVALARQDGVRASTGTFITFVDSDDTLPADALENLYGDGKLENVDIVSGRIDNEGDGKTKLITIEAYRKLLFRICTSEVNGGPWAKLIRRELFDGFDFIPIKRYQDVIANIHISFKTERPVRLVGKKVYNYFLDNQTSACHEIKIDVKLLGAIQRSCFDAVPDNCKKEYAQDMFVFCYSLYVMCFRYHKSNVWVREPYYPEFLEFIKRYRPQLKLYHKLFLYIRNPFLHKLCRKTMWYAAKLLRR